MKTSILKLASILSVVFTLGTAQAAPKKAAAPAAADEKPAAAEKAAAKKATYPLYGEVVAVTKTLLTIKGGEGKEDRKLAITADTKFNNDGKPATAADIMVGKKVGGLIEKSEKGNDKMLVINVGVKQEAAAKTKDAAGKKPEGKGAAEPAKATKKKAA